MVLLVVLIEYKVELMLWMSLYNSAKRFVGKSSHTIAIPFYEGFGIDSYFHRASIWLNWHYRGNWLVHNFLI
jgi:hypothetical protein